MPLESFEIKNEKVIELAKCDKIPKLMIIAGANGVGKSTLLHILKTRPAIRKGTGELRYIPPHRDWRTLQVPTRSLLSQRRSYAQTLTVESIPGLPDIRIESGGRAPTTSDESTKLIKFSLGQLEMQRGTALANSIDEGLDTKELGKREKFFKPLIDLTRTLLPHLEFHKVVLGEDKIDCFWKRAKTYDFSNDEFDQVEIDELSSGEKAILILFFPFIEFQLEQNLKKIKGNDLDESKIDIVVFIDEPELHIHPVLQSKMLNYLRDKTKDGVQFIIATQSSTILDDATSEELFLLTQRKEPDEDDRNQLIRLTTDDEKLEALKALCGDIHAVTSGKSLICVEGELPEDKEAKITDKRILEILCPEMAGNLILPLGGKYSVLEGARRIRETLPKGIPGLRVFSLIDGDRDDSNNDPTSFKLPVCSIENFLLDPESIMQVLDPYREHSPFENIEKLNEILQKIVSELTDDEKRIRISEKLGVIRISFSGTDLASIIKSHEEGIVRVKNFLPESEELKKIINDASKEVEKIISEGQSLKRFRGKKILKKLYNEYIKNLGFSYNVFTYNLAKTISEKSQLINELCDMIKKMNELKNKKIEKDSKEK